MQGHDHLLELLHTDLAVVGVGGVGALGGVVVHGIVAPVEVLALGLVHGAVVVDGQQVQVGDAQVLQVVDTGGNALCGGGAFLREGQILAPVGFADAGGVVNGEVTDMELIEDGVGIIFDGVGVSVVLPALGVGGIQVDDHAPLAVDAGGPGVRIHGFHRFTIHGDGIGVVGAVQIAVDGNDPGAVLTGGHGNSFDQVIGALGAGGVQIHADSLGGGSPDPEGGAVLGPEGAQLAVIGEFLSELVGGVDGVGADHMDAALVFFVDVLQEGDLVTVQVHQLQLLGQAQDGGAAGDGDVFDDPGLNIVAVDGEGGLSIGNSLGGLDDDGVAVVVQLHGLDLVGIDHVGIQALADGEVFAHPNVDGAGDDVGQVNADLAALLGPVVARNALADLEGYILVGTAIQHDGGDALGEVILRGQILGAPGADVPFGGRRIVVNVDLDRIGILGRIADQECGILITACLGVDPAVQGIDQPLAVHDELVLVQTVDHILQLHAPDAVGVLGHVGGVPVVHGAGHRDGSSIGGLVLEGDGGVADLGADGNGLRRIHDVGVELTLAVSGGGNDPLLRGVHVVHLGKGTAIQLQVHGLRGAAEDEVQTLSLGGFKLQGHGVETVLPLSQCGAGPGAGGGAGIGPGVEVHVAPVLCISKVQGGLIGNGPHGAIFPGIGGFGQKLAVVPVFAIGIDHDVTGLAAVAAVVEQNADASGGLQIGQLNGVPVLVIGIFGELVSGPAAVDGGIGAGEPAIGVDLAPHADVAEVDGHIVHGFGRYFRLLRNTSKYAETGFPQLIHRIGII